MGEYVVLKVEDWEYILAEGGYLSGWSPHTENYDFDRWKSRVVDDVIVTRVR